MEVPVLRSGDPCLRNNCLPKRYGYGWEVAVGVVGGVGQVMLGRRKVQRDGLGKGGGHW